MITLRRSKTDQEGQERNVAFPYGSHPETCPVRGYREWVEAAGLVTGAVFREIDRHSRVQAGPLHKDSVGLSLRAATQAYRNGANEFAIMQQTGHRSLTTVRKYIREDSLFRDNPASKLGLRTVLVFLPGKIHPFFLPVRYPIEGQFDSLQNPDQSRETFQTPLSDRAGVAFQSTGPRRANRDRRHGNQPQHFELRDLVQHPQPDPQTSHRGVDRLASVARIAASATYYFRHYRPQQ